MGSWEYPHQKLGITEDEYASLLGELYSNNMSHSQIAVKLGIHKETIRKNCRKYGIVARTTSEAVRLGCKVANLTANQSSALDGILLGDGHLDGNSTVSARMTYGCKFRETLVDIATVFDGLHFSKPWVSKTGYWHFKSSFYTDLKPCWNKWYINKKKIVPSNLQLSQIACYWWFVGDGYQVDYGLQLCTDDFDAKSISILCFQLSKLGFDSSITPSSNRVRIKGRSAPKFLDWLRPLATQQYLYKWNTRRRQCRKPRKERPKVEILQTQILQLSGIQLAKHYGVTQQTLKRWLDHYGIINPRRMKFYNEQST
jgi:transposase